MKRSRPLNTAPTKTGTVVYWMSRDQRARDNWALLEAQKLALEAHSPLCVVFCLAPTFGYAPLRAYQFMLQGLKEVKEELQVLNIAFALLSERKLLPVFLQKTNATALVCDFSPLREPLLWKKELLNAVEIPIIEVDAHNIVPAWLASPKAEIGARTLRPKIHRLLPEALTDVPKLEPHPFTNDKNAADDLCVSIEQASGKIRADKTPPSSNHFTPGTEAGYAQMDLFFSRLSLYDSGRNNPVIEAQSGISPWLHFGQISAQRVAFETLRNEADTSLSASFLEELIVRRELSDNFCLYRPNYDSVDVFPTWAQASLRDHLADPRPYNYSIETLEKAQTHDPLWNAAQMEMVITGKMHGWMRMYWGKKILEWSPTPEEAMQKAIFLNDRYSLDGRDPNGYAGIAWCIGGIHDRAWPSRPIFGKIRYMNAAGAQRKFDTQGYIRRVNRL